MSGDVDEPLLKLLVVGFLYDLDFRGLHEVQEVPCQVSTIQSMGALSVEP